MGYHGGMIAQKYRNSKYNFYLLVSGPAKDGASLWKLQRSFDLLRSLPSTALRAGRMTMDSAALTTGPGQMLREIPHPCKNRKDGAPD